MVPEGGAAFAYLFLAGLCCFGAIFFGLGGKLPVWKPPKEVGLPPKSSMKGVPN